MDNIIREVTDAERPAFNKLATHITQSWEWGTFRLSTGRVTKVVRLGIFQNRTLLRAYQLFFHEVPYLGKIIAYLPRSLNPPPSDLRVITDTARRYQAVYLKLEPNETEGSIADRRARPGRQILPRHSFILDLRGREEDIIGRMQEKTRYNIRLAQKKGVRVVRETDPNKLEQFITLHEQTQKRQGFFAKSGPYLRTLWESLYPKKMVYLLCAYPPEVDPAKNPPLAALMLFHFRNTLYYPYGGWSNLHRELMPNNLLHFEAIKLGLELGCESYDFWSSFYSTPDLKDPWYGTYIFKKGFGPREVHYIGSWDIPFDPTAYSLLNIADDLRLKSLRLTRKLRL